MIPTTGKAIQCATSHNLGQNFSKMFGISFESEKKTKDFAWQTSWGMTTRTIGVAVMTHGDDKGLVLPPRIAPIQIVLIPIINVEDEKDGKKDLILNKITEIFKELKSAGLRAKLDDRDNYKPGWKYNYWEMKGVPMRVEFGLKDLNEGTVVLFTRDNFEKTKVKYENVVEIAVKNVQIINERMLNKARNELYANIKEANNFTEFFKLILEKKMVQTMWCTKQTCEESVKKEVKAMLIKKLSESEGNHDASEETLDITEITAKTLCIPLEQKSIPEGQKCFFCSEKAEKWVNWGKSY
jgi:prolyl-tRNA synthetase